MAINPLALEQRVFFVRQAQKIQSNPHEQAIRPEIRLAPSVESNRFKGRVAIEALQAEYDAITELAELTDGQMRADIALSFDGEDLYGPDGRSLTDTAQKGLKAARQQVKTNPNLWFEVGRRSTELDEVLEVVDMLKKGEHNTMILTTNFPWALKNAGEDIGGYNVTRQQALRRAIMVNPGTGKITMISQTLDRSDERALAAIDQEFDFETDPSQERLGQRQFLNLTAEEQSEVMDRSISAYDHKMTEIHGGEWYAGRRPIDYRNTYNFVRQQTDLIDTYKNLKLSGKLTDDVMYNLAATINARFKAHRNTPQSLVVPEKLLRVVPAEIAYDPAQLYKEMKMHGNKARSEGQTFSACGGTYKANGLDESTEELLKLNGMGSSAEKSSWHGGKIHKNKECAACKKVKSEVGACHICKDCVNNPPKNVSTSFQRKLDEKRAKAKPNKEGELAPVISLEEQRRAKKAKVASKVARMELL